MLLSVAVSLDLSGSDSGPFAEGYVSFYPETCLQKKDCTLIFFFCEEVRWLLSDNSIKYDGSEVKKRLVHYPFFQSFTLIINYAVILPLVRNAFSIVLLKLFLSSSLNADCLEA